MEPNSQEDLQQRGSSGAVAQRRQGRYWIGTIPRANWVPCLPEGLAYVRGQLEQGETGYEHWQVLFIAKKKISRRSLLAFGLPSQGHYELTRSSAAEDYVWKEDTRIGEPFEFGERPIKRNSLEDWDRIRTKAQQGKLDDIPADIYVRCYHQLNRIRADHAQPAAMVRSATVFWGPTGVGKSRRAWELAGPTAYVKDPRTKFWCGYRGSEVVVIDEFRGGKLTLT